MMPSDLNSHYREALAVLDRELTTRSFEKTSDADGDDLQLTYRETFVPGQDRQEYLRTIVIVLPGQDEKLSLPITAPIAVSIVKKAISPETGREIGGDPIIESDRLDLRADLKDDRENLRETIRDNIFARLSNWLR